MTGYTQLADLHVTLEVGQDRVIEAVLIDNAYVAGQVWRLSMDDARGLAQLLLDIYGTAEDILREGQPN